MAAGGWGTWVGTGVMLAVGARRVGVGVAVAVAAGVGVLVGVGVAVSVGGGTVGVAVGGSGVEVRVLVADALNVGVGAGVSVSGGNSVGSSVCVRAPVAVGLSTGVTTDWEPVTWTTCTGPGSAELQDASVTSRSTASRRSIGRNRWLGIGHLSRARVGDPSLTGSGRSIRASPGSMRQA